MSGEDLGRQVTQLPGFSWEPGMVNDAGPGEPVLWVSNDKICLWIANPRPCKPEVQVFDLEWFKDNCELKLDHPANAWFLANLLWRSLDDESSFDISYGNCQVTVHRGETSVRYAWSYNETVCHALTRILVHVLKPESVGYAVQAPATTGRSNR